jgi:hypothetical protein
LLAGQTLLLRINYTIITVSLNARIVGKLFDNASGGASIKVFYISIITFLRAFFETISTNLQKAFIGNLIPKKA